MATNHMTQTVVVHGRRTQRVVDRYRRAAIMAADLTVHHPLGLGRALPRATTVSDT